jgi:shikimate kinase
MKIALIGMMGSGKTELGRMLASHYGVDFFDLDSVVEERAQMRIADMFCDLGEKHFRDIEENSVKTLAERDISMVLGCGGGVVLRDANRLILKKQFITVWLEVPLLELARRLSGKREHRPLLSSGNWVVDLENILHQREELYRESAIIQYTWRQNHSPEDSAEIIESLIDTRAGLQGAAGTDGY